MNTPKTNSLSKPNRRDMLRLGGASALALGIPAASGCRGAAGPTPSAPAPAPAPSSLRDWAAVRREFDVSPDYVHMAGMLVTSHPRVVREAIDRHRRGLDDNPAQYLHKYWGGHIKLEDEGEERAMRAAARYLSTDPGLIALTDSTTMGLSVIYNGVTLRPDQEILLGYWNHDVTYWNVDLRVRRSGCAVRKLPLPHERAPKVSADELVDTLVDSIRPTTRVVGVTWVHSATGLKLPVGRIGARIAEINRSRAPVDRVLFCVDGVHGFGIEDIAIEDLHCDFFAAGCHKWLFGPRGTGIVWGTRDAYAQAIPTIPSFSWFLTQTPGRDFTPGGFHSFEHRWALAEAFEFHQKLGKQRIQERIHDLAQAAVEGLAKMPHVRLRTPRSREMLAGIVCFEVANRTTHEVLEHLHRHRIVASSTPEPDALSIPRLSPGLLNDTEQVEQVLRAVAELT